MPSSSESEDPKTVVDTGTVTFSYSDLIVNIKPKHDRVNGTGEERHSSDGADPPGEEGGGADGGGGRREEEGKHGEGRGAEYHVKTTIEGPAFEFLPLTSDSSSDADAERKHVRGMVWSTKGVPCDDSELTKFLRSTLVVSLVSVSASASASAAATEGEDGGQAATSEEVISEARLPLANIVTDDPPTFKLNFESLGSLTLNLLYDDKISDKILGGSIVTARDVTILGIPDEWKVAPVFNPQTMTSEGYHEIVRNHVNPPASTVRGGGDDDDEEAVDPPPPPSQSFSVSICGTDLFQGMSFGRAVWSYEPLDDGPSVQVDLTEEEVQSIRDQAIADHERDLQRAREEADEEKGEGSEQRQNGDGKEEAKGEGGEEEAPWEPTGLPTTREVPTPRFKWSLTYPDPAQLGSIFMSSDSISALTSASGAAIPVVVARVGSAISFGADGDAKDEAAAAAAAAADADKKGGGKKGKDKKKGAAAAKQEEADATESEAAWEISGSLNAGAMSVPGATSSNFSLALSYSGEDESRQKSTLAARPTLSLKLAYSSPLVEEFKLAVDAVSSMGDVVGERQWKPKEKPKDIAGELRRDLEEFAEDLSTKMKVREESI